MRKILALLLTCSIYGTFYTTSQSDWSWININSGHLKNEVSLETMRLSYHLTEFLSTPGFLFFYLNRHHSLCEGWVLLRRRKKKIISCPTFSTLFRWNPFPNSIHVRTFCLTLHVQSINCCVDSLKSKSNLADLKWMLEACSHDTIDRPGLS